MNNKQPSILESFFENHPRLLVLGAIMAIFIWSFAILTLWNESEILFSSNWIPLNIGLILSLLPITFCLGYVILAVRKKSFWVHITKKSTSNRHPFLATFFLVTVLPFLLYWQTVTMYRLTIDLVKRPVTVTGTCGLSRQVKDRVKYGRYIAERIDVTDDKSTKITLAISEDVFMQYAAPLTSPDTFRLYSNDSRQPVKYECSPDLVTVKYLMGTKRVISIQDAAPSKLHNGNN